jgi:hypothetical protein
MIASVVNLHIWPHPSTLACRPDRGVLVAWQDRAAFLLCAEGGAYLHQFRSGNGLGNVHRNLSLKAR